tara:strand:+ start:353 stop:673 length:321 start_codon:yes stop_codon:yes gene_type:complete
MPKYSLKEDLQGRVEKRRKINEADFNRKYENFLKIIIDFIEENVMENQADMTIESIIIDVKGDEPVDNFDFDKMIKKFNESDIMDLELKRASGYRRVEINWEISLK